MWRQLSPCRRVVRPLRIHPHVRGRKQAVKIRAGRRAVGTGRQNEVDARPVVVDARPRGRAPTCVRFTPATLSIAALEQDTWPEYFSAAFSYFLPYFQCHFNAENKACLAGSAPFLLTFL